ncbi:MAG: hypothetical protein KAR06_02855 [Deltaproteobacteria bacterium]|nr:hypothetical protein [Deltaproteobacteria bacterium]
MAEEIQCAHYEKINRENIGTCIHCGQVKQYPLELKGKAVILKAGDPAKANMKALKNQIPIPPEQEEPMSPTAEQKKAMTEKNRYYEENKEAIIACLKEKGRKTAMEEWSIPDGSIGTLMNRWLTEEEREQVLVQGVTLKRRKKAPVQTPPKAKAAEEAKTKTPPVDLERLAGALGSQCPESLASRAVACLIVDLQEVLAELLKYNKGLGETPQPLSRLNFIKNKIAYISKSLNLLLNYYEEKL